MAKSPAQKAIARANNKAKAKTKAAKQLKKDKKQLKCDLKDQKAKTKKAKAKASPMARRFTKTAEKAPTFWAFIILIVTIVGVVAFYYREHGPTIAALLLLAGAVAGGVVWAFQSVADKKNHK